MAWVLFISVWRASACSPGRELCCLDGETEHRACTKKPFWYCGCNSVSLGLNWRKSRWHIQESRPNAEKLSPLKSCCLLLRLTCIFSQVVGGFHVVYCDDKKKLQFWIRHERQSLYNLLSILALVIWPKHKKPQRMHQLYIFSNFRDIYLITENICSKEDRDC